MSSYAAFIKKYSYEYARQLQSQATIQLHVESLSWGGGQVQELTITLEFAHDHDESYPIIYDGIRDDGRQILYGDRYSYPNSFKVFLPWRDFEHIRHMLQTESPLTAYWVLGEDSDSNHRTSRFAISTSSREPIGEGFSETAEI